MTNELDLDPTNAAPAPALPRTSVPTLLERLFAMAQRYRKDGNLRQASEMYWTLVTDHADTPQAQAATSELLLLAEGYERAGNQHMARGMYERLMDLQD